MTSTPLLRKASLAWALCALGAMGCDAPEPADDGSIGSDVPMADVGPPSDGSRPDVGDVVRPDAPVLLPDAGPLPRDPCIDDGTCPLGTWVNVTPADMADLDFGAGPVVGDPGRPTDLYMAGGGDGLWRSTDYGNHWERINDSLGYTPMGLVLAVAPTTPATLWFAVNRAVMRSTDGGASFESFETGLDDSLYSIQVDPYDYDHLISGRHELDGIVESVDGGETWRSVTGPGFPSGGISWFVSFLETGDPATSRGTWLGIAQGGGVAITRDGGASWTVPAGIEGLEHAHGNAQIHQVGSTLWVPGIYGPGSGIYRSTDFGVSFERVVDGNASIVWGTSTHLYSMYGWACSRCDLGSSFSRASLAGDDWASVEVPPALNIGANHIAVTSDGEHDIFVGTMWGAGVWRYVEP